MKIILDTNIIISALCFPFSKPRKVFDLSRRKGEILVSIQTLNELETVLMRPKFDKYIDRDLRLAFLNEYSKNVTLIESTKEVTGCRDEKDNKYLSLAVSSEADYIISGDKDLLVLDPYQSTRIISPDQFIELQK